MHTSNSCGYLDTAEYTETCKQINTYAKYALAFNSITHIQTEYQSIKSSLRQRTVALWKHQWTDTTQTTQLRRIKPELREWSSCNRNNRQEEKVLARMRLGHTLYTHSYIYTNSARPTCARCQIPITMRHIIIDCPTYNRERQGQRQRLTDYCNKDGIPFDLNTILGDAEHGLHDVLFSFLRNMNLFLKL